MNVSIDEAGHEDAVTVAHDLQVCRQARQQVLSWTYRCDVSAPCHQQSILQKLEAAGIVPRSGIGMEVENGAPVRPGPCSGVSAGRHDRSKLAFRFALVR